MMVVNIISLHDIIVSFCQKYSSIEGIRNFIDIFIIEKILKLII